MADLAHAPAGRRALRRGCSPATGRRPRSCSAPTSRRPRTRCSRRRTARPADRAAGSWSPTATCAPSSRSRPTDAYAASRELIDRWHGHGRLRYAVTPRFSVSCTDDDARRLPARCSTSARRAVHEPRQREPGRDRRSSSRAVPGGARLPRHLRGAGLLHRPLGARPQRPRLRRRAARLAQQPHRRRALPVQQRVPGLRDLPHGAPRRARRALRDGHRRRRRHRA